MFESKEVNEGELSILPTDGFLYKNDWPVVNLLMYKDHYMWIKNMLNSCTNRPVKLMAANRHASVV